MSVINCRTHDEWLRERQNGLGASDAGSIIGVSPWKTNVQLWAEKTGQREPEDISEKPPVKYGHDAEPHIRALFALDHPKLKVEYTNPYKIIRNDVHPFIFCTPDGELWDPETGRHGGLEIKTTEILSSYKWKEWKDGNIPQTYYAQVLHQMIATGWDFVWLVAQIKWTDRDGNLIKITREYYIDRNDVQEDIDHLTPSLIEFWKCVQTKTCPPLKLPQI